MGFNISLIKSFLHFLSIFDPIFKIDHAKFWKKKSLKKGKKWRQIFFNFTRSQPISLLIFLVAKPQFQRPGPSLTKVGALAHPKYFRIIPPPLKIRAGTGYKFIPLHPEKNPKNFPENKPNTFIIPARTSPWSKI